MDIVRIEFEGRIPENRIAKEIQDFRDSGAQRYLENRRYVKGDNVTINDREFSDTDAPNHNVAVPYGRKIVNTVVGYMYRPGSVRYASEDEAYLEALNEVFDANKEPLKTAELGKQTTIQGVGYEFHYIDAVPGDVNVPLRAMPRFAMLPANEVIPIYSYDVEPKMTAFIRVFTREEQDYADVYYPMYWDSYEVLHKDGDIKLNLVGGGQHNYPVVPLNVYRNNEEQVGDFEPVLPLIDVYDLLLSDSVNEFDRFAQAYLVLKGFGLSASDVKNIKIKRAFENLDVEDAVAFLTKEIPHEFIKFMSEWCRSEIHSQSGIPNVTDIQFGSAASGSTIDKFIYLMELFTDPKEALFRDGLIERIKIINSMLATLSRGGDPNDVEITMTRNLPQDDYKNAETLEKYSGHVSEKTLIQEFAPFVKDVDEELEALKEEKQESIDLYQSNLEGMNGESESERSSDIPGDQQDSGRNGARGRSQLQDSAR